MRIPVVGVGGVGCYFGGLLAHAEEDVVFITRGAPLRAIRNHGLQIDDVRDKFVVNSARATGDPSKRGPAGTILVGVKAWHIEGAFETLRSLMPESTFAVTLIDGVEAPYLCRRFQHASCCSRTQSASAGRNRPPQPEKDVFKDA